MGRKATTVLTDHEKLFLVRALAAYEPPTSVAKAFQLQFGKEITPQRVESYDPTKMSGERLGKKLKTEFFRARESYLNDLDSIPEASKAVRVRNLAAAAKVMAGRNNHLAAAQLYEQIAKEVGGHYESKRQIELTGKDGGPVETKEVVSRGDVLAELEEIFGRHGATGHPTKDQDSVH